MQTSGKTRIADNHTVLIFFVWILSSSALLQHYMLVFSNMFAFVPVSVLFRTDSSRLHQSLSHCLRVRSGWCPLMKFVAGPVKCLTLPVLNIWLQVLTYMPIQIDCSGSSWNEILARSLVVGHARRSSLQKHKIGNENSISTRPLCRTELDWWVCMPTGTDFNSGCGTSTVLAVGWADHPSCHPISTTISESSANV